MSKLLSLIVPCYNESDALPHFYDELMAVCDNLEEDYEVLFIDDGSDDETLSIIKRFSSDNSCVSYYSFSRNFGKEAAIFAGLCNSKGDYVAILDADMQDPPSLIPQMMEQLRSEEYDCVATRRITRKGEPIIRSLFARLFYSVINRISDVEIVDGARDFRIMKRPMVDAVIALGERNRFSKGIFSWVGFKTCWIDYENKDRVAGKTKWNFWQLTRYALDGITGFSDTPLAIASFCGIVFSIVGFLAVIFIVVRKILFGDPVAGWASTVSIITFIGGSSSSVSG